MNSIWEFILVFQILTSQGGIGPVHEMKFTSLDACGEYVARISQMRTIAVVRYCDKQLAPGIGGGAIATGSR